MSRRRTAGSAAVALGVVALWAPSAEAATINVTNDLDESANNTTCSLREAITSANTNGNAHEDACTAGQAGPSLDTIVLLGTSYEILGNGDDANVSGDFDIAASGGPVTIDGDGDPGSPATGIDANNTDRIFHVDGDPGLANQVTIRDMLLQDGRVTDDIGGTILLGQASLLLENVIVESGNINGTVASAMRGAGLAANGGLVVIVGSNFNDNTISAQAANAGAVRGGAIHLGSAAEAAIVRSTISDNAIAGDGDGVGDLQTLRGGGLATIDSQRDLAIVDSTIDNNFLVGGDTQEGGGVDWDESGDDDSLRIRNTTFSGNSVGSGNNGGGLHINAGAADTIAFSTFGPTAPANMNGAGYYVEGGAVSVAASVFATETDDDCNAGTSLGHNVEQLTPGDDCHFTQPTDVFTNLQVLDGGGLDDNGGPTRTEKLAIGTSPAIDHVPAASCLVGGLALGKDQRGVPRPADEDGDTVAECDAGAYEVSRCHGVLVNRVGTSGDDGAFFPTFSGTAGADGILGLGGNDIIDPGGGADAVCAGPGDDFITDSDAVADLAFDGESEADTFYASGFGGDTINLAAGTATVGTDTDPLLSIENAEGGIGNDVLVGDGGPNRLDGFTDDDTITGGGGSDTLLGGDDEDGLFARDGAADTVDCGDEADTAQTDQTSLESTIGCETVDALAAPVFPQPPAPAPKAKKCKKKKKRTVSSAAKKCKRKKRKAV